MFYYYVIVNSDQYCILAPHPQHCVRYAVAITVNI